MDPDAAFNDIFTALRDGDHSSVVLHCATLFHWVATKGYPPNGMDSGSTMTVCRRLMATFEKG